MTKSWVLRKSILQVFLKSLVNRFSMCLDDRKGMTAARQMLMSNESSEIICTRGCVEEAERISNFFVLPHERVRD